MPGSRIVRVLRGWIYRNARLLSLLSPVLLLAAVEAWARAGGGGSYSSGRSSYSGGRSGGGSGGEDIIIRLLIELVFRYPAVGIPLVIGICVFAYYSSKEGKEVYVDYTIRKGIRAQKDNLRQAALQALRKRDPQFSEEAFLTRVERAFLKVQKAWCDHNLASAQAFLSDGVLERFGLQIQEQKDKGLHDRMEGLKVLERRVAQIQSDAHFDTMHVYIRASAVDYEEDLKTKKPIGAVKAEEEFEEYWSFLRKPGAKSLSVKGGLIEGVCPNCGAPLEVSATVKCPYCQALLRSGEYDWVLAEITQGCEWAIQESKQIPGVRALTERDAGFNVQHLEDRASVIFWRFTTANRLGVIAPLRKMCCEECAGKMAVDVGFNAKGIRRFYGNCAVGSVDVRGIAMDGDFDRAYVEIRWSGTPLEISTSDRHPHKIGNVLNFHHGFILRRKPEAKTDVRNALVSSHCPNCGGPEGNADAPACEYCGTVVNDGSYDWVLEQIVPVGSAEFRDKLQALRRAAASVGKSSRPAGAAGTTGPTAKPSGMPPAPDSPFPTPDLANTPGIVPPASATSSGEATAEAFGIAGVDCVRWLIQMMLADGVIEDKERDYLKEFAAQCGVAASRLEGLIGSVSAGGGDLPVPENLDEARALLKAIAGMALADGRLSPDETALLIAFGRRIGLTPIDVNMLVKQERQRLYQLAQQVLRMKRHG